MLKTITMARGIIYVMTAAVPGLVKIGKTGTSNYKERMRFLEANGYNNVTGFKRFLAIELEDYNDKESLLHEIFSKHQVGSSELYALDKKLIERLLLAFDGKWIYPEGVSSKTSRITTPRRSRKPKSRTVITRKKVLFNFYSKGLRNGTRINFAADNTITAIVVSEREVEYEGQKYKLSPLTRKIYQDKKQSNKSGAYQGALHWCYKGRKLTELPDLI